MWVWPSTMVHKARMQSSKAPRNSLPTLALRVPTYPRLPTQAKIASSSIFERLLDCGAGSKFHNFDRLEKGRGWGGEDLPSQPLHDLFDCTPAMQTKSKCDTRGCLRLSRCWPAFAFLPGRPSIRGCSAYGLVLCLPRRCSLRLLLFCTCPRLGAGALWPMPAWVWHDVRFFFLLVFFSAVC